MQPQLGHRLKAARLALGYSQQRLAGTDMSAAFISMIENGRIVPSQAKLRILAERLKKPLEYLMVADTDAEQTAEMLLEGAQQSMIAGQHQKALKYLDQAARLSGQTDNLELQVQVHLLAARCLSALGQLEDALCRCEAAVELYHLQGKPYADGVVEPLFELANIQFQLEEYGPARRSYERVIRLVAGLKSRSEIAYRAQCYMGTCIGRLGDLPASLDHFRTVLRECDQLFAHAIWVEAALGLTAGLFQMEQYEEAYKWACRAEAVCTRHNSPLLISTEHNIAVIQGRRGNWEAAYVMLKRCLASYHANGQTNEVASALEELARYWIHKGKFDMARQVCQEALHVLESNGAVRQRARIYRALGEIALLVSENQRAVDCLQISAEFFRRTRSQDELVQVQQMLRRLRGESESPQMT